MTNDAGRARRGGQTHTAFTAAGRSENVLALTSSDRRGQALRTAWPYIGLSLLAIIFHSRMLFTAADQMASTVDLGYYFVWLHQYTKESFLNGGIPFWNPYNYCGTPFAANPQAAVFYPLSWLHLLMPVIQAEKWMIALHAAMAGSFMFLFLRRVGLSAAPALIGAIPYMAGNYFMANATVGHLTMLFTMTWIPLALYCVERAIQQRTLVWMGWAGVVMGVQFIAGEPQNCYYTGLLLGLYALIRTLCEPGTWRQRGRLIGFTAAGFVLLGVLSALIAGIQLLPTLEFATVSDRSANTYEFATHVSAPLPALAEFVFPWSNRAGVVGWKIANLNVEVQQNWEMAGYVGMLTLALAAISIGRRSRPVLLAAQIILPIAILMMVGKSTPVYRWMYEIVPGLSLFRVPARAVVIVHWALCVMAAFGVERLINHGVGRDSSHRRWCAACIVLLGAMLLGVAALWQWGGLQQAEVNSKGQAVVGGAIPMYSLFMLRPLAALVGAILATIIALSPWRQIGILALISALTTDLFLHRPKLVWMEFNPESYASSGIMSQLQATREGALGPSRCDLPPLYVYANAGMAAKVEFVNGYSPMSIGRFFRYVHAMRGQEPSLIGRSWIPETLYQVGSPFPLAALNVGVGVQWDRVSQKYTMVTNNHLLPRAWFVSRWEVVADEDAALRRMKSTDFDAATTALLEQKAPERISADAPVSGRCRTIRISDHELRIDATVDRDALMVVSEIRYPGWKATIDGHAVDPIRADSVITAVPVPAGTHQIRYFYSAKIFWLGAAMTMAGVLAAIGMLVIGSRRGHGRPVQGAATPESTGCSALIAPAQYRAVQRAVASSAGECG